MRRLSIVFLLLLCFPLFAEPRLEPDRRLLGPPAQSAVMESEAFARIALVASGCEDSRLEPLLEKLRTVRAELKASLPGGADDRAKAEAALSLLYKRLLNRYSEYQTRVDVALETGEYNCVSSAILFAYLAKTAGLKVAGVETPDHAFCTVEIEGRPVDVETTNPYGFDPGARKELTPPGESRKLYAVVPQAKYLNRKPIDDRRLIALVYANRISMLERSGDFSQAVGLAVDARRLQGDSGPLKDIVEPFLNYAISLSNAGRGEEALGFIRKARGLWGDYPGYHDIAEAAMGNALSARAKDGDFAGAFGILDDYSSLIDAAQRDDFYRTLTAQRLYSIAGASGLREALASIADKRSYLRSGEYEELLVYAYSREADRVSRGGAWLAAASVLDEGLAKLPGQRELARQRSAYRQNYAIEVHNQFVAAYNRGDAGRARQLLENGIQAVPESQLLKNDLRLVQ